ncbi:MAG: hypothetical protein NW216_12660 [Hyphomicrobium sp.]|nr:hypothetical protein [Hyphomicrobium sp.]
MRMRSSFLTAAALGALMTAPLPLAAGGPFSDLAGSWRGQGRVHLEGGHSEALSCKAYYTSRDDGAGLGIALSCASQSNKIDLRAAIASSAGRISGTWEERAFNSNGSIDGLIDAERIELKIDGTVQATMSITLEGKSQLVSIASDGKGFTAVDLELERI